MSEARSLNEVGEDETLHVLLGRLPACGGFAAGVLVGVGDDCAVVRGDEKRDFLLKTDAVVEGVHFSPDTPAHCVGRKALARAVSDVAAMGGTPLYALITLAVHASRDLNYLAELYHGLGQLAAQYGVTVVGGETTSLPREGLVISVALVGSVPCGGAVLRSTAQVGDVLAVTGKLGGSLVSGRHLTFEPRVEMGQMLAQVEGVHAMMDLSDGLGTDLPRMLLASSQAANVPLQAELDWESIPCHDGCTVQQAVSDGEDYELLVALSEVAWQEASDRLGLTKIGRVIPAAHAVNPQMLPSGWEHFVGS